MPGFNGTGPNGMGPLTGGGRGYCRTPGAAVGGRPYGASGWMGRRRSAQYSQGYTTREQEAEFLRGEVQELKNTLSEIDARIRELAGAGE